MSHKTKYFIGFLLVVLLATACKPKADMPNPASVFCEENGGKLEIRTDDETGGQVGYCVFPDGSECEEWAYFRGECQPGESQDIADMPNPASVYCEENDGKLEIRTDEEAGGQVGYCVFPDGSECEEWAYYQGECQPGESQDIADMPNPASVLCEENGGSLEIREDQLGNQVGYCRFTDGSVCEEWAFFSGECEIGGVYPVETMAEDGCKIYRNDDLGYSFHFPADALIISSEDPMKTVTIQGALVDGEYWPMIFFNHPYDQPEYLIPEGVDLEDWLEEVDLLMEERLEDTMIAGEMAIHLRQDTVEQAYPSDRYFFAREGQIYSVVFLHTNDKEDWAVYDHFLESIQFDE